MAGKVQGRPLPISSCDNIVGYTCRTHTWCHQVRTHSTIFICVFWIHSPADHSQSYLHRLGSLKLEETWILCHRTSTEGKEIRNTNWVPTPHKQSAARMYSLELSSRSEALTFDVRICLNTFSWWHKPCWVFSGSRPSSCWLLVTCTLLSVAHKERVPKLWIVNCPIQHGNHTLCDKPCLNLQCNNCEPQVYSDIQCRLLGLSLSLYLCNETFHRKTNTWKPSWGLNIGSVRTHCLALLLLLWGSDFQPFPLQVVLQHFWTYANVFVRSWCSQFLPVPSPPRPAERFLGYELSPNELRSMLFDRFMPWKGQSCLMWSRASFHRKTYTGWLGSSTGRESKIYVKPGTGTGHGSPPAPAQSRPPRGREGHLVMTRWAMRSCTWNPTAVDYRFQVSPGKVHAVDGSKTGKRCRRR